MIQFYFMPAPNPMKVALMLEETELPYEAIAVDGRKGQQFAPEYLAINPNAKAPTIVDADVTVFDSNAILLYLAEKTGKFLSASTPRARGEMLSWLMFVATGIGPYSGQAVHFNHFAPDPKEYPLKRYNFEARRHWGIIDARLATRPYLCGDTYTLVDMALWGWSRAASFVLGEQEFAKLTHVKRHLDEVNARPAAVRAAALKERFQFKSEWDDEARRFMFPFLAN
jgi:GST-like protein